jgi:HlyD family secretion protein
MISASSVAEDDGAPGAGERPLDLLDREGAAARHRARERRRTAARRVRQALGGLALVAGVVAAGLALRPSPVPVDVAVARRAPLSLVIEETGVTRVKDRFVVSSPVSGSLSRISFEPGDLIREGDALAQLAPLSSPLLDERTRAEAEARLDAAGSALGQTKAQVGRATAASELAAQELARTRRLVVSGSLANQALEQAEFTARMRNEELSSAQFAEKIAKEELRIARVTLGMDTPRGGRDRRVEVLAPVSGQILRVHQKSAGVVPAGTPLVELGDPRALELVVDLLTTDAVQVTTGTPVVVTSWGGEPLNGRVSRVEPSGFTRPSALGVDEQRVNAIVVLTDPPERWARLGDGYRVETRLELWRGEAVLQVPSGAVFRRGDGWAVFRIRGDVASLVTVRLGHRGEHAVEVLAGVGPGDRVAVHPGDRVKDGVRVAESRP